MKDLTIKVERRLPTIPVRTCDGSARVDGEEATTCKDAAGSDAWIFPAERIDESTTHERKEQTHG